MYNLEIAQIQNIALKTAALEVDASHKKDGYIDSSEIFLFTEKAKTLLNEKQCTQQEYDALFVMNEVGGTNDGIFAKVDSLHRAQNTPEALAEEEEKVKQAKKQEKIKKIKAKIAQNNVQLNNYMSRLAQKDISYSEYESDFGRSSKPRKAMNTFRWIGLAGALILTPISIALSIFMSSSFIVTALAMIPGAATTLICHDKANKAQKEIYNPVPPEEQEKVRNEYKEAYLKISKENEQLKAELAELQE